MRLDVPRGRVLAQRSCSFSITHRTQRVFKCHITINCIVLARLVDCLLYQRDLGLTDSLLSSRWSISHAELIRQLEEERARTNDLEAARTRQVATIADLETEIQNLRLNGYDGRDVLQDFIPSWKVLLENLMKISVVIIRS